MLRSALRSPWKKAGKHPIAAVVGDGGSDIFQMLFNNPAALPAPFAGQNQGGLATVVGSDGQVRYVPHNLSLQSRTFTHAIWIKGNSPTVTDTTIQSQTDGPLRSIYQSRSLSAGGSTVTARWRVLKTASRIHFGGGAIHFIGASSRTAHVVVDEVAGTAALADVTAANVSLSTIDNGDSFDVVLTATDNGNNTIARFFLYGTLSHVPNAISGNDAGSVRTILYTALAFGSSADVTDATTTVPIYRPGIDHDPTTLAALGMQVEGQATNHLPNSEGVGFVVGTPGTVPATWAVSSNGVIGLSRQIVAQGQLTGVNGGFNYVDVRFFGTTTSAGSIDVNPVASTVVSASSGQTWTGNAWVALVGGALPGTGDAILVGRNAAGSGLESSYTAFTAVGAALTRIVLTLALSNATTAFIQLVLRINGVPSATTVDFTLRIARPQLEQGLVPTSYIPNPGTSSLIRPATNIFTGAPWITPIFGADTSSGSLLVDFWFPHIVGGPTIYPSVVTLRNASEHLTLWTNADGKVVLGGYGGTAPNAETTIASGRTDGQRIKAVIRWTTSGWHGSVNGGAVLGNAANARNLSGLTELRVGSLTASTNFLNSEVYEVTSFKRLLSDAEMQARSAL